MSVKDSGAAIRSSILIGHPCLFPRLILIGLVKAPLISVAELMFWYMIFNLLIIIGPYPSSLKVFEIKECDIRSKAFLNWVNTTLNFSFAILKTA